MYNLALEKIPFGLVELRWGRECVGHTMTDLFAWISWGKFKGTPMRFASLSGLAWLHCTVHNLRHPIGKHPDDLFQQIVVSSVLGCELGNFVQGGVPLPGLLQVINTFWIAIRR